MKKPWSLSTTVRNPERILPFLSVLKQMEGEEFNVEGEVKYQTLLIQNRLYKPTNLPSELDKCYEATDEKMSYEKAEEIFGYMKNRSEELAKDPGLRGRVSVSPLTKMGLAIAKKSSGKVIITELGNLFLESEDLGELFFRFFLKWQIPNPGSDDYSLDGGYDVKPFVASLHLINIVNKREKEEGREPIGISRQEFYLFIPTLVNYEDIEKHAEEIISLRKELRDKSKDEQREIFKQYSAKFVESFLETNNSEEINRLLSNLKDYGDNIIRYFRLTRFIYIRGGGYYVDLEKRRQIEIHDLLAMDNASSVHFSSEEEYVKFLGDITVPDLPWENIDKLKSILNNIIGDTKDYEGKSGLPSKNIINLEQLTEDDLKKYIEELREYRRQLQERDDYLESQEYKNVEAYIATLKNIYDEEDRSIALEKYITLSMRALNDALQIKPNYPVGDDNEPTFTAPAGKADIECFYEEFNAICEVTMLTTRDQWVNEGQPVMRHLRDFEDHYGDKIAYCIFIAPKLHIDTLDTFMNSIVGRGYRGKQQKIVPINLSNFVKILEVLVERKRVGKTMKHEYIKQLFDLIIEDSRREEDPEKWMDNLGNIIVDWSGGLSN